MSRSINECASCGAQLSSDQKECKYCGSPNAVYEAPRKDPLTTLFSNNTSSSSTSQTTTNNFSSSSHKSKGVAGIIALFFGGLGLHKFYLGQNGMGIMYLLFSWTGIPSIIGFFEAIGFFLMSDSAFNAKYN